MHDWGSGPAKDRFRALEVALNSRPDSGKLFERLSKIGRIVNNKATQSWPQDILEED
jgi:hypothetical protein